MRKLCFLLTLAVQVSAGGACYAQQLSLSLERMFVMADSMNTSIKAARLGVQEAEAGVKVAKNAMLPSIEASLSASYNGDGYIMDRDFKNGFTAEIPSFGNNFKLEVSQVIYAGGAIKNGVEISEIGTELAVFNAEKNRNEVRFLIAGDYIELCKLANQQRVLQENIKLAQSLGEVMRSRVNNGTALKTDITRIELLVKNLEYSSIQVDGAGRIVSRELANSIGVDVDTKIIPADDFSSIASTVADITEAEALDNSPAIKAADAMVRMSEKQVAVAKSDRLPHVALFAGEYLNGPVVIEIPAIDKNFNYWAVGVGVSYKIDNLYKSRKVVGKSKLAVAKSREQLNMAREQISLALSAAQTDYYNSFQLLETKMRSVELAKENYNLVRCRYEEGLAVITDLLDASNQLLDAQIQEVNARMNIAYNYYKLKYISGII